MKGRKRGFRRGKLSLKSTDALNTQDKDPRYLGLRADLRRGAQRADAASSPERPLLPRAHLSDLPPPVSSTLPSQWTAWVRAQMGKNAATTPF